MADNIKPETPIVTEDTDLTKGGTAPEAPKAEPIDIEALKAELRAELMKDLKAEMKADSKGRQAEKQASVVKDAQGLTADETKARDAYLEEYVVVQLFKDGKDYKDDVFIGINGQRVQVKRGIPVKMKRKFAMEIDQSQIQSIKAAEYSDEKQNEYEQAVNSGRL
jgi:hypothetical protein